MRCVVFADVRQVQRGGRQVLGRLWLNQTQASTACPDESGGHALARGATQALVVVQEAWHTRHLVMVPLPPQSDIYFTAATTMHEGSSGGSSKGASAHTSPQTPPARDTPLFPSSLGEGKIYLFLS